MEINFIKILHVLHKMILRFFFFIFLCKFDLILSAMTSLMIVLKRVQSTNVPEEEETTIRLNSIYRNENGYSVKQKNEDKDEEIWNEGENGMK